MYTKLQNYNMLFLGYVRFLFVGGSTVEEREAERLLMLNPDVTNVYVRAPPLCGAGLWHVNAWPLIQGVAAARTFPVVVTVAGCLPIESGATWLTLASAFPPLAGSA